MTFFFRHRRHLIVHLHPLFCHTAWCWMRRSASRYEQQVTVTWRRSTLHLHALPLVGRMHLPNPKSPPALYFLVPPQNSRTLAAHAAFSLRAARRWCLSGTPMQNSLQDLFSYFKFLVRGLGKEQWLVHGCSEQRLVHGCRAVAGTWHSSYDRLNTFVVWAGHRSWPESHDAGPLQEHRLLLTALLICTRSHQSILLHTLLMLLLLCCCRRWSPLTSTMCSRRSSGVHLLRCV